MDVTHPCVITLSDNERWSVEALVAQCPPVDVAALDDDDRLTRVALTARGLPDRIAWRLLDFKKNSNEYGTLVFRGLPRDPVLPPTPNDGRTLRTKPSNVSEYSLLFWMLQLGEPIAYADEKEGALIQNICPVPGRESRQENSGSEFLEFHTENGFHPYRPDFIGLLCLRPDHDGVAETLTASAVRAASRLSGKSLDLLFSPLYRIQASSSFGGSELVTQSGVMPVLSGDPEEPEMCVDYHAMEAVVPDAADALQELKAALKGVIIGWRLTPGDLLIVDNQAAVHARTGFRPRYDGEDRWLQRMFVRQDLRQTRPGRPRRSHVCAPLSVIGLAHA
jgi:L-asparagine oxygenase